MNESKAEFVVVKDSVISPETKTISPKKYIFLFSYLASIPIFIIFVVLFSLAIKYSSTGYLSRQAHRPQYVAVPQNSQISTISVESEDGRIQALDDFFASYNSPLEGHAKTIVVEADLHNIDYRFLPAIAMQESTLRKKIIKNSYNCWGFGIYGGKVTRFNNYDEAIKVITSTLAKKYIKNGYQSPEEIVKKYTPNDTGKWSDVVSLIMTRLKKEI